MISGSSVQVPSPWEHPELEWPEDTERAALASGQVFSHGKAALGTENSHRNTKSTFEYEGLSVYSHNIRVSKINAPGLITPFTDDVQR